MKNCFKFRWLVYSRFQFYNHIFVTAVFKQTLNVKVVNIFNVAFFIILIAQKDVLSVKYFNIVVQIDTLYNSTYVMTADPEVVLNSLPQSNIDQQSNQDASKDDSKFNPAMEKESVVDEDESYLNSHHELRDIPLHGLPSLPTLNLKEKNNEQQDVSYGVYEDIIGDMSSSITHEEG